MFDGNVSEFFYCCPIFSSIISYYILYTKQKNYVINKNLEYYLPHDTLLAQVEAISKTDMLVYLSKELTDENSELLVNIAWIWSINEGSCNTQSYHLIILSPSVKGVLLCSDQ